MDKITRTRQAGEASRKKILNFVKEYWLENHASPTFREVGEACNISSTSVVWYHLHIMEKQGLIHPIKDGTFRAIIPAGMIITIQ